MPTPGQEGASLNHHVFSLMLVAVCYSFELICQFHSTSIAAPFALPLTHWGRLSFLGSSDIARLEEFFDHTPCRVRILLRPSCLLRKARLERTHGDGNISTNGFPLPCLALIRSFRVNSHSSGGSSLDHWRYLASSPLSSFSPCCTAI